jgi:hypothetical protein
VVRRPLDGAFLPLVTASHALVTQVLRPYTQPRRLD